MRILLLTGFLAAALTACSLGSSDEQTSLKAPETTPDGGAACDPGPLFPDGGYAGDGCDEPVHDAAWLDDGGDTWHQDGGDPWPSDGGAYDGGAYGGDGGVDHPPDGAWLPDGGDTWHQDGGVDHPVDAGAGPHPH